MPEPLPIPVRGIGAATAGGPEPEPGPVACRAPFTSMYLDQRGNVRACCMNDRHPLGNVADAPLAELWKGAGAQRLRRAMERSDLGLGCDVCAVHVDAGRPELAYSRWFEAFALDGTDPVWPRQLELSLSNTCNLRCVMCNGEWSSSIRAQVEGRAPLPTVYGDAFFEDLRPFLAHLDRVKFYGGEPFLAVETLRVMELLVDEGLTTRCHVTTNATQWTPRVERILSMLPVDVSVSLDAATKDTYESIRRGASWDDVRRNLDRFCEWAERRDTWVSVTFCLMTANWHEMGAFFRLADHLGIDGTINQVSGPADLSLAHLALPELSAVVEALEFEDGDCPPLDQNRPMWEDALDDLRRRLADEQVRVHLASAYALIARAAAEGRPFADAATDLFARAEASPAASLARDQAAATCARFVRLGSPRVDLDPTGHVRWVDEGGVLGIPPDALMGRHHRDLPLVVGDWFASVVDVANRHVADQVEISSVHLADGRCLEVFATPVPPGDDHGISLYFSWGELEREVAE